jgi:hypothetical protein
VDVRPLLKHDESSFLAGYVHGCILPFQTSLLISLLQVQKPVLDHYSIEWLTEKDLRSVTLFDATRHIDPIAYESILGKNPSQEVANCCLHLEEVCEALGRTGSHRIGFLHGLFGTSDPTVIGTFLLSRPIFPRFL